MARLDSARLRQFVLYGSLGVIALMTATRVAEYDSSPWGWIAVAALGTALLFGPVVWVVRDGIARERRERLGTVVAAIVMLCMPIVIGLGLVVGSLLVFVDVLVLGSTIGFAIAAIAERTLVPERLRGSAR